MTDFYDAYMKATAEPVVKPLAAAKQRIERGLKPPKPKKKKRTLSPASHAVIVAAGRAKLEAVRLVTITLAAPHSINAVWYGPGSVTVPKAVAAGLLEAERRVQENNRNFDGQRGMIITGRGMTGTKIREVPYYALSQPAFQMPEFESFS